MKQPEQKQSPRSLSLSRLLPIAASFLVYMITDAFSERDDLLHVFHHLMMESSVS